jgi:protease II
MKANKETIAELDEENEFLKHVERSLKDIKEGIIKEFDLV